MTGTNHARAMAAAAIGTAVILAYAVAAAVQILVLNPLAAAPGLSLTEISAAVDAAGESLGTPFVIGVLGLGVVSAAALFALTARRRQLPVHFVVVAYLGLIALGAVAYLVASFGAGMALADTFGIAGGDHAPWATVLYVGSALAAVAAIVTIAAGVRHARRHHERRQHATAV